MFTGLKKVFQKHQIPAKTPRQGAAQPRRQKSDVRSTSVSTIIIKVLHYAAALWGYALHRGWIHAM